MTSFSTVAWMALGALAIAIGYGLLSFTTVPVGAGVVAMVGVAGLAAMFAGQYGSSRR